jgi:predicted phosphodiesterase
MTYGVISDIHANLDALEAVLAELAGVEAYLCLGDIVGYGPDPGACVERLRGLPRLTCIAGNHDLAAIDKYDLNWFNPFARQAIEWTSRQLSPENRDYLARLELKREVAGAVLVHGALPEPMDYITTEEDAAAVFAEFEGALCFVGHTHIAEYYRSRKESRLCERFSLWSGGEIEQEPELRYIVNPGAVGQPRDNNPRASFGTYDSEAGTIEIHRVDYDIESVQARMQLAGLPQYLIDRLALGR